MTDHGQNNIDLTFAYYEAGQSGQWEAVAEMLAPDFFATEASTLPVAGVHHGIEGLKNIYEKLTTSIEFTGYDVVQVTSGGDWVVTLMELFSRDTDGSELRLPVAEALRWRDGKLCEMKPYWFDSNLAQRAVKAKSQAAG